MTLEELKALGLTDEQANKLFAMNGKEVNAMKAQISELEKSKTELETLKNEKMTDQEKLDAAIKKAEETEKKYNRALAKSEAEKIFVNAGVTASEYSEVIEGIVSEDMENTKKLAEAMAKIVSDKVKAKETEVTEKLTKQMANPPKPDGSPDGNDGDSEEVKLAKLLAKTKVDSNKESEEIMKKFLEV